MDFYEFIMKPYQNSPLIIMEAVGCFFGILSVYFSVKKNIWVYPTGIISTSAYTYILLKVGLIGDTLINMYYTIMSIYGWILWAKNSSEEDTVQVQWATKSDRLKAGILFFFSIMFVLFVYYLKPFIHPLSPSEKASPGLHHLDLANWLDIIVTAIFFVGMWLMAKRRIDNWLFWITGDLVSIPMYAYKGLGITMFQYCVFIIMAITGFYHWKKGAKKADPLMKGL
ncbi:MAG: nicotinamide mononucleotide transporter [Bergeyella sp.]|nr:nicotinamide mononucleotide transporter [Bergeyella sp.]